MDMTEPQQIKTKNESNTWQRRAIAHVTKDRHVKALDPTMLVAMKWMQTTLDAITVCAPTVHKIN